MLRLLALLALAAFGSAAHAAKMALEPQNRIHFGASLVDTDRLGLSGGLDSRLTRVMSVDLGGFTGFWGGSDVPYAGGDIAGTVSLQHGLWVAPGLRVPHRYGDGLIWDVFFRAGFGTLWSKDLSSPHDDWLTNPAALGGGDLLLRGDAVGVRASGKLFFYRPFPYAAFHEDWIGSELNVFTPQFALEAIYQW